MGALSNTAKRLGCRAAAHPNLLGKAAFGVLALILASLVVVLWFLALGARGRRSEPDDAGVGFPSYGSRMDSNGRYPNDHGYDWTQYHKADCE